MLILIVLLLLIAVLVITQLNRSSKVDRRYAIDANLQNLDEEIALIEQVSREVLTHLQIDTNAVKNPLPALPQRLPKSLRDPFIFPGDLVLAKKQATTKKTATSTAPPKVAKKPPEPKREIRLAGIIYDKSNPMAIINGNIYRTADKIDEFTIKTINEQGVLLVSSKERLFLEAPIIE